MKVLKRIIRTLVIIVVILYVLPVALLQIPAVQQKVAQSAIHYLERKIGTKVEIREVDFRLFNQLILKDVYMEDQQGDTLLIAKRMAAGIEFFPLFKKQFRFKSIQLYTFSLCLGKDSPDDSLNIQYIIDAFRDENPSTKTFIDLRIENLSLKGGTVSYRIGNATPTPDLLNPNNLYWKDISGKIRVKHFSNDSLIASAQYLSAAEQSGFSIKQLTFDLSANANEAKINRLELELPQSELFLADVLVNYSQSLSDENRLNKMEFNGQIEQSRIRLDDVSALFPVFKWFNQSLNIQGMVSGALGHIQLKDFLISSGDDMNISLGAVVRNLDASDLSRIYVNGRIHDSYITTAGIQQMANNFGRNPIALPESLQRLGSVSIEGNVSGLLNDLTATVSLQTEVGDLQANVNFGRDKTNFLTGKLTTTGIDLKPWLANDDLKTAGIEINLNAHFINAKDWTGQVDASINEFEYKAYRYGNIAFSGDFTSRSFSGSFKADGQAGYFAANGSFDLAGENSKFNFSAEAADLLLGQLSWMQKYENPKLSFAVDAGFTGNDVDNLTGKISFRKLSFSNNDAVYLLDSLCIESLLYENQKRMQIRSDLLTGTVDGTFSFHTLSDAFCQTVSNHLPSLIFSTSKIPNNNPDFHWDFTINNSQELSSILELPVTFYEQSHITGEYNRLQNHFRLNGNFSFFKFGASNIENCTLDLNNSDDCIEMKLNGTHLQRKGKLFLSADIKALNDSIRSSIRWNNSNGSNYKGELDFTTQLAYRKENRPLTAFFHIQPSEMVFNDSIWKLSPTAIHYKDGCWNINHFEANHNQQRITITGNISQLVDDQIDVSLNEVDLDYIFKSLNIKALTFGGIATGFVKAKDLYATRQLSTRLDIRDFSFNDVVFGTLDLRGNWDNERQGVKMEGDAVQDDDTYVNVDGYIFPMEEEISIVFDAHRANAAFLHKYLNNVAKDISGQITGKIRLFGDLNRPTVEGDVWVDNGSFGIDVLNTRYAFSDWVRMTPDEISIRNMELRDIYGNKAIATGYVRHDLLFDFRFNVDLSYRNFLIFDADARISPEFYGRAYATGTAAIKGTEKLVNIDVSLQNNENTTITLNFMEQQDIMDFDFINFVTREKPVEPVSTRLLPEQKLLPSKSNPRAEIRSNLSITVTPEATLEIIMDPATGDKISSTGDGNLRIEYGTKIPLQVFGNYRIEKGVYNFSLQQAFFWKFKIAEGSSVNFHGDPFLATLNIKAAHTVSANLGDLDQQLIQQTENNRRLSPRDNISVNTVLLLSGPLEQPVIKFDLEFPGATAEIERQVKSYIRTDDMMNRQMIYLLLMGRFYTAPEYMRSDTRYNNDLSLLTSTLSSYLNSMFGNLSDKFQIGAKFHQTYENGGTNTEMELLLSSTLLNNRLIINGNFGYIDNPYTNFSNKNVPLIGDFDIEYRLTRDIRLRGFNRYNYRNFYSSDPEMTQGVGILFRRDFNNLQDLFGRNRILPALVLPPAAEVPVAPADTTSIKN